MKRFVFSAVIHPVLSAFLQNYAGAWRGIVESGVVAEFWSSETRFSRADCRDVAEVAVIALTKDRLKNERHARQGLDRLAAGVRALRSPWLARQPLALRAILGRDRLIA